MRETRSPVGAGLARQRCCASLKTLNRHTSSHTVVFTNMAGQAFVRNTVPQTVFLSPSLSHLASRHAVSPTLGPATRRRQRCVASLKKANEEHRVQSHLTLKQAAPSASRGRFGRPAPHSVRFQTSIASSIVAPRLRASLKASSLRLVILTSAIFICA